MSQLPATLSIYGKEAFQLYIVPAVIVDYLLIYAAIEYSITYVDGTLHRIDQNSWKDCSVDPMPAVEMFQLAS